MTRCTRCGREASTYGYRGDADELTLCVDCLNVYDECDLAIATIERYANSVHAGGVIARLREVAAHAD